MAYGGKRGQIVDHGIIAAEAVFHESLKAAFTKTIGIAIEIVPPHLIDDDANHQFWPLRLLAVIGWQEARPRTMTREIRRVLEVMRFEILAQKY